MTDWPAFLAEITRIERTWMGTSVHGTQDYLPWMPYSVPRFVMYLTDAMGATRGDLFLDVGCGPGTKIMLAEKLFGLDGYGFDRVPEYVDAATEHGVEADVADALAYDSYDVPDILYVNKPCHGQLEVELERKITAEMKPGAVLILCNAATRPPEHWLPIASEWDMNSGVWLKP